MSIVSRIESINEHLEDAYDSLEDMGADLTGINKNLENLSIKIQSLYPDLQKITNEGTKFTLTPTKKGKMELNLKSNNIKQVTTTGKNLLDILQNQSTVNGVTFKPNPDGSISVFGQSTGGFTFPIVNGSNLPILESGTYTLSLKVVGGISKNSNYVLLAGRNTSSTVIFSDTNILANNTVSKTATLDSSNTMNGISVYVSGSGTKFNCTMYFQIESGSSVTTWEPYSGKIASPYPLYPQDMQIINGDNLIKIIGKNHFDKTQLTGGWISKHCGEVFNQYTDIYGYSSFISVIPNTTYTLNLFNSSGLGNAGICEYSSNQHRDFITSTPETQNIITFTTTNKTNFIRFTVRLDSKDNVQLEKGDSNTTIENYQGQNYLISLGVKNLFDKTAAIDRKEILNPTTARFGDNSGWFITDYIKVNPNTYYTVSGKNDGAAICFFDANKNSIGGSYSGGTGTFKTNATTRYIILNGKMSQKDTFQLEKGVKINSYTPYGEQVIELCQIDDSQDYIYKNGNNWYKKQLCGEVVFDGTEEDHWTKSSLTTVNKFMYNIPNADRLYESNSNSLCNYFMWSDNAASDNPDLYKWKNDTGTQYVFIFSAYDSTTVEDFKDWLKSHSVILKQPLITPIDVQITNTTLITQLNSIYENIKSYDTQTNILQDNNSIPIIISASAIKKNS